MHGANDSSRRFYHFTPQVGEFLSQNHNSRIFYHKTPTFGVIIYKTHNIYLTCLIAHQWIHAHYQVQQLIPIRDSEQSNSTRTEPRQNSNRGTDATGRSERQRRPGPDWRRRLGRRHVGVGIGPGGGYCDGWGQEAPAGMVARQQRRPSRIHLAPAAEVPMQGVAIARWEISPTFAELLETEKRFARWCK